MMLIKNHNEIKLFKNNVPKQLNCLAIYFVECFNGQNCKPRWNNSLASSLKYFTVRLESDFPAIPTDSTSKFFFWLVTRRAAPWETTQYTEWDQEGAVCIENQSVINLMWPTYSSRRISTELRKLHAQTLLIGHEARGILLPAGWDSLPAWGGPPQTLPGCFESLSRKTKWHKHMNEEIKHREEYYKKK